MEKIVINNQQEQWQFLMSFLKYWNNPELSIWGEYDASIQALDEYNEKARKGGEYVAMNELEQRGYEYYFTEGNKELATAEDVKKTFINAYSIEDFDELFFTFGFDFDHTEYPEDHEFIFVEDEPLPTTSSFEFPTMILYIIEYGFDRCGSTSTTIFEHVSLNEFTQYYKFFKDGISIGYVQCNCGWFWDGDLVKLYNKTKEQVDDMVRSNLTPAPQYQSDFDMTCNIFFGDDVWDTMEAYGDRWSCADVYTKISS